MKDRKSVPRFLVSRPSAQVSSLLVYFAFIRTAAYGGQAAGMIAFAPTLPSKSVYSLHNPPSDAELQTKFQALTAPQSGDKQSHELSERILSLEDEKNVKRLMMLCRPTAEV